MDRRQALQTLNDELTRTAQRRKRNLRDAEQCALEIGATTTYLRDELGQTKTASAERAGVSPSHLTEWMANAREQGAQIDDPLQRIAFLNTHDLVTFLLDHGGLARIVASFADDDCFFLSGVSPDQMIGGSLGRMRRAHMMVQTMDDQWAAVDNVTVGYSGTGPTNALGVLEKIGLDEDLARRIAYQRVSDVRFAGGPDPIEEPFHTKQWPHVHLSAPEAIGDAWAVKMNPSSLVRVDEDAPERDTPSGFYPTTATGSHLERWLDFLDQHLEHPGQWCGGVRQARVYLDEYQALQDGFSDDITHYSNRLPSTYTVVIEQGSLQLWLALPTSNDPGTRFTPETYEVLRLAGFYVDGLEDRDNRSAFWRWLSRLGEIKPPFVDLGGRPLTHAQTADR